MLYVMCYIYTVCTAINPQLMCIGHGCKIINPGHHRSPPPPSLLGPLVSFRQSWDDSARGFFSTLRVCMLSCQLPYAFLWYPLTLWLVCILSWHCSAWTQVRYDNIGYAILLLSVLQSCAKDSLDPKNRRLLWGKLS